MTAIKPLSKEAVSFSAIARAATKANQRGVDPARLQQFWKRFDNWSANHTPRQKRFLDAEKDVPLTSQGGWLTQWFRDRGTVKKLREAMQAEGVPRVSMPKVRLGRVNRSDSNLWSIPTHSKSGPQHVAQVNASRDWPMLLHESGHAVDLLGKRNPTGANPVSALRRQGAFPDDFAPVHHLTSELRANRFGRQLAKRINVPWSSAYTTPSYDTYQVAAMRQFRDAVNAGEASSISSAPAKFRRLAQTFGQ